MDSMPTFITFEGVEGSGKSTQIHLLADRLRSAGQEVLVTREPGGCPIADAIRRLLLDPGHSAMSPHTELLLYAAARAQHVEEIVRPALGAGKIVLCDRFSDATFAYQGEGRGLDRQTIMDLNQMATQGLRPDLTLLLDIPVAEGLARAIDRNDQQEGMREDRFEQESLQFHQKVRDGYLKLAAAEERFRIVDARGTQPQVAERIDQIVGPFLRHRAHRP